MLSDADRMMQRQNRDRRGEADALRSGGDIGEHEIGAGEHPQRAEVMLADPRRAEAHLFGINRLVDDVGDEPIGAPGLVRVTIVASREIAEFHSALREATPAVFAALQELSATGLLSSAEIRKSSPISIPKKEERCRYPFFAWREPWLSTKIVSR